MQRLKLRIEESGEKLSAAYAPPKWSETAGKVKVSEIYYIPTARLFSRHLILSLYSLCLEAITQHSKELLFLVQAFSSTFFITTTTTKNIKAYTNLIM